MDRYFQAFEAGSMSEADCAPRLQALRRKLSALAERRAELMAHMDDEDDESLPTASELIEVQEAIERALQSGTEAQRKVVMQKLVAEVQVESRSLNCPGFDGG
jgi:site-specific DNA recombinase